MRKEMHEKGANLKKKLLVSKDRRMRATKPSTKLSAYKPKQKKTNK